MKIAFTKQGRVKVKIRNEFEKTLKEVLQAIEYNDWIMTPSLGESLFKTSMDTTYNKILNDAKLLKESGLSYDEYKTMVVVISCDCTNKSIKIIATLGKRDAYGCSKWLLGLFIISIGLCLIICDIDPDKTYSWYSGIWHGLFFVQNSICGLFTDNISKANHYTTAYNVLWWITTVINTFMAVFWGLACLVYDTSLLKGKKPIWQQ